MRDQKLTNLKMAFEQFLVDQDASALVAELRFNRCRPPKDASYPNLHRVLDFIHESNGYRVTRLVAADSEDIFIESSDFANPDETGVPYRLQGLQLRQWMDDATEKRAPELNSGEVDWGYYLGVDFSEQQDAEQDAAGNPLPVE